MRYPVERTASGSDGSAPSPPTLLFAKPVRWTAQRKAELIVAVRQGDLGQAEACKWYKISPEEFSRWKQRYEQNGLEGLKVFARTKRSNEPLQSPVRSDALAATLEPDANTRINCYD